MNKNPQMFRCKLQNASGQRVTYIGPFEGWSREWHMVFRAAATGPRGGMAA